MILSYINATVFSQRDSHNNTNNMVFEHTCTQQVENMQWDFIFKYDMVLTLLSLLVCVCFLYHNNDKGVNVSSNKSFNVAHFWKKFERYLHNTRNSCLLWQGDVGRARRHYPVNYICGDMLHLTTVHYEHIFCI